MQTVSNAARQVNAVRMQRMRAAKSSLDAQVCECILNAEMTIDGRMRLEWYLDEMHTVCTQQNVSECLMHADTLNGRKCI